MWNNLYTPLPPVDCLPDEWSLPPDTNDMKGATGQSGAHDPSNDESDASCDKFVGVAHQTPNEDEPVDDQQPGDDLQHAQAHTEPDASSGPGMGNQQGQKHTKRRGFSDGEMVRKVAQRHGMHIMHDGALSPLGRSKKPNTTKLV
jgi:hypothetical protein